jgi:hypothetical protein
MDGAVERSKTNRAANLTGRRIRGVEAKPILEAGFDSEQTVDVVQKS